MKQLTPHTITDVVELTQQLKKIRKLNYAIDNQELHDDTKCIAVGVRNHQGQVIAAISISMPSTRWSTDKFEEFKNMILAAADEISHDLGWLGKSGR